METLSKVLAEVSLVVLMRVNGLIRSISPGSINCAYISKVWPFSQTPVTLEMQVVVLWNVIMRLLEIKGDGRGRGGGLGGGCQGFVGEGVSALSHKYELKVKTEIRTMVFWSPSYSQVLHLESWLETACSSSLDSKLPIWLQLPNRKRSPLAGQNLLSVLRQ